MVGNEHLLIAAVLLFVGLILVQIMIARETIARMAQFFEDLDSALGQALQNMGDNVSLGTIDPPNPLQMMLLELIKGHFDKKPFEAQITNLPRDESGKFAK